MCVRIMALFVALSLPCCFSDGKSSLDAQDMNKYLSLGFQEEESYLAVCGPTPICKTKPSCGPVSDCSVNDLMTADDAKYESLAGCIDPQSSSPGFLRYIECRKAVDFYTDPSRLRDVNPPSVIVENPGEKDRILYNCAHHAWSGKESIGAQGQFYGNISNSGDQNELGGEFSFFDESCYHMVSDQEPLQSGDTRFDGAKCVQPRFFGSKTGVADHPQMQCTSSRTHSGRGQLIWLPWGCAGCFLCASSNKEDWKEGCIVAHGGPIQPGQNYCPPCVCEMNGIDPSRCRRGEEPWRQSSDPIKVNPEPNGNECLGPYREGPMRQLGWKNNLNIADDPSQVVNHIAFNAKKDGGFDFCPNDPSEIK